MTVHFHSLRGPTTSGDVCPQLELYLGTKIKRKTLCKIRYRFTPRSKYQPWKSVKEVTQVGVKGREERFLLLPVL